MLLLSQLALSPSATFLGYCQQPPSEKAYLCIYIVKKITVRRDVYTTVINVGGRRDLHIALATNVLHPQALLRIVFILCT